MFMSIRGRIRQPNHVSARIIISIAAFCFRITYGSSHVDPIERIERMPLRIRNLIINGQNAPDQRFTFAQVSLMLDIPNDESTYDHQCGGSLVATDMILSAAHCRQWFSDIDIDRYNFADPSDQYEDFHAANIVIHPRYDSTSYRYDFMLIQLNAPMKGANAPPIRLNSDSSVPSEGADLLVLGWGTTDNSDPSKLVFPSTLQEGALKYITNDECETTVIANKELYKGEVYPEMMCASSSQGIDACSGDSGGPLIIEGSAEGDDLLVGLVSWGRGCAIYPGVYSRISSGYDWIRKQICYMSSDPPEYLACSDYERNPTYLTPPSASPIQPTATPISPTNPPIQQTPAPVQSTPAPNTVPFMTPFREIPTFSHPIQPTSLPTVTPVAAPLDTPSTSKTTPYTPPSLFSSENSPVAEPTDSQKMITVLVEIQLDAESDETGWYILSNDGQQLFNRPAGTYWDRPNELVWEVVQLPINQTFYFVITDASGNGMCCSDGLSGWFRLSLKRENQFSSDPTFDKKDKVVPILTGTGEFGSSERLSFQTDYTVYDTLSNNGLTSRKNDNIGVGTSYDNQSAGEESSNDLSSSNILRKSTTFIILCTTILEVLYISL